MNYYSREVLIRGLKERIVRIILFWTRKYFFFFVLENFRKIKMYINSTCVEGSSSISLIFLHEVRPFFVVGFFHFCIENLLLNLIANSFIRNYLLLFSYIYKMQFLILRGNTLLSDIHKDYMYIYNEHALARTYSFSGEGIKL